MSDRTNHDAPVGSQVEGSVWGEGKFCEPCWFRKASPAPGQYPEHLVVFVHGIKSDWRLAWENFPGILRKRMARECDMVSFSYPSKDFQAASYKRAADSLYNLLTSGDFQYYRHIIFIVHSTGGLVVKRALLSNLGEIRAAIRNGTLDMLDPRNLVLRTRRIINYGVPHRGGSLLGKVVFTLLSPLLFVVWTVLCFVNLVASFLGCKVGRHPLGYNWIAAQLTWGSRELVRLEDCYLEAMGELDRNQLPRPISSDFVGANDKAIARAYSDVKRLDEHSMVGQRNDHSEKHLVRRWSHSPVVREGLTEVVGDHSESKVPVHEKDQKVALLWDEISSILDDPEVLRQDLPNPPESQCLNRIAVTVADRTLVHIKSTERNFEIVTLIEAEPDVAPPGRRKDIRRSVEGSWLVGQSDALKHLLGLCLPMMAKPLVVTGLAGVGKSSVLRRLASVLGTQFLNDTSAAGLPLYMPLFRFEPSPQQIVDFRNNGMPWQAFAEWWCNFANNQNRQAVETWPADAKDRVPLITPGWLNHYVRTRSVVVILDGVDEFLTRNALLGYDTIDRFIKDIQAFNYGVGCVVVLGVRSSLALPSFVQYDSEVIEVASLTPGEAKKLVHNLRDQDLEWKRLVPRLLRRVCRHYHEGTEEIREAVLSRIAQVEKGLAASGHSPELKFAANIQSLPHGMSWEEAWRSGHYSLLMQYLIRLETAAMLDAGVKEVFAQLDRELVEYSVEALLKRLVNPQARKLVFTPLVLAKLLRADWFDELEKPADIFREILNITITESKLPRPRFATEQWVDLVTLLGHLYFVNFWPSTDFDSLAREGRKTVKEWEAHWDRLGRPPELGKIILGFKMIEDDKLLELVLSRSVFLAANGYRLEHREWEDYLAARYLYLSVRYSFVQGLCRRGSWTRMHFLIGEMMSPTDAFTAQLVDDVHECATRLGLGQPGKFLAQVPIGNLMGIMGHSTAELRPVTLAHLLEKFLGRPEGEIPPLVELVVLNTLGFRTLRQHVDDVQRVGNAEKMLEAIDRTYHFGTPGHLRTRNSLTHLTAWIIGKGLANILNRAWACPVPPFQAQTGNSQLYLDACRFTANRTGTRYACNPLDETMQRVFINILPEMIEVEEKALAAVCYLPAIVAAELNGVAVSEVTAGLSNMLGDAERSGELTSIVLKFANRIGVPELANLWSDIRRVYLAARPPARQAPPSVPEEPYF